MQFDIMVGILLEELKIVAAAIKLPSGKVVAGKKGDMHANLHDRIINRLSAINNVSREAAANRFYKMYGEKKFQDGFIDSEGNFQSREEAWQTSKKYNKRIADRDKELESREDGDGFRKMASEWITEVRRNFKQIVEELEGQTKKLDEGYKKDEATGIEYKLLSPDEYSRFYQIDPLAVFTIEWKDGTREDSSVVFREQYSDENDLSEDREWFELLQKIKKTWKKFTIMHGEGISNNLYRDGYYIVKSETVPRDRLFFAFTLFLEENVVNRLKPKTKEHFGDILKGINN
jgi:hypothetical protein